MEILHLNKQSFEKIIAVPGKSVLVDFWATWCGPCQKLAPVLEELAADYPDLIIGKVDVDQNMDIAAELGINTIPALFFYRDSKLEKQLVGFMDKASLAAKLGL